MDRETLEKLALETVSAEYYYDLADNISDITDADLYDLIACKGDYRKEIKLEKELNKR